MKKFVKPFIIAGICMSSASLITSTTATPTYANNITQSTLKESGAVIYFNNAYLKMDYKGHLDYGCDFRTPLYEGFGTRTEDNLQNYNLDILQIPSNTTVSFDASNNTYMQKVTSEVSTLVSWASNLDDLITDTKFSNIDDWVVSDTLEFIAGERVLTYHPKHKYPNGAWGRYLHLVGEQLSAEEYPYEHYNFMNLSWFDVKDVNDYFSTTNSTYFRDYTSNQLSLLAPITQGNTTSVTLDDGIYFLYSSAEAFQIEKQKYIDENTSEVYTVDNFTLDTLERISNNGIILIVGGEVTDYEYNYIEESEENKENKESLNNNNKDTNFNSTNSNIKGNNTIPNNTILDNIQDVILDSNISMDTGNNIIKVVNTYVNMREEAHTSCDIIRVLAPNETVEVLEIYTNAWNKIMYNGEIGYIYGEYLSDLNPTENKVVTSKIATIDVNIRVGASTNCSIIKVLREGETVTVTEAYDNGWNKVIYNGQIGYVYSEFLK